jgi:hypothetical protein
VFAAVAVVLGESLVVLVVALRTLPAEDVHSLLVLRPVHVLYPLSDAAQVHRYAAAGTGPDGVLPAHLL